MYLIVDDLTQSVIDGPYETRSDAEQALLRIGLDSAYIAESSAPEASRPGAEQIEALRRRWRHIAGLNPLLNGALVQPLLPGKSPSSKDLQRAMTTLCSSNIIHRKCHLYLVGCARTPPA